MMRLIGAEIRKMAGLRSTWGIVAGMVAVVALGVMQAGNAPGEVGKMLSERQFYFLATINGGIFLLVLGAKAATDEFRHNTIVPTLLVTPRRERVVASKVLAVAAVGLAATVVTEAVMVVLAVTQTDVAISATALGSLAGFALSGALWAGLGVGIGWIVRHQVGAIVGLIVWLLVAEQMIAARYDWLEAYLFGGAGRGLAVAGTARTALLAGSILVAYAAATGLAATIVMKRRDIV